MALKVASDSERFLGQQISFSGLVYGKCICKYTMCPFYRVDNTKICPVSIIQTLILICRSRMSSSSCYSPDNVVYMQHATGISAYPCPPTAPVASSALSTAYHSTSVGSGRSCNTRPDSPPPSAQVLGEYFNAGQYGVKVIDYSILLGQYETCVRRVGLGFGKFSRAELVWWLVVMR